MAEQVPFVRKPSTQLRQVEELEHVLQGYMHYWQVHVLVEGLVMGKKLVEGQDEGHCPEKRQPLRHEVHE